MQKVKPFFFVVSQSSYSTLPPLAMCPLHAVIIDAQASRSSSSSENATDRNKKGGKSEIDRNEHGAWTTPTIGYMGRTYQLSRGAL